MLRFIIGTEPGAAINARAKALETVSITVNWLFDKEKEIEEAFNPRGLKLTPFSQYKNVKNGNSLEFNTKVKQFINNSEEFKAFKRELTKKSY